MWSALQFSKAFFRRTIWAYTTLFAMLLLTGWAYYVLDSKDGVAARTEFEFRKGELLEAIERRLAAYTGVLYGGLGLFKASNKVTRDEWRIYIETLNIKDLFPGIQGIGYAEFVKPEDRTAYENAIRSEGFPEFSIRPEGKRELYSSITYLEPFDKRNYQAFGYDMYSQETRRAAMDRARDTGEVAISGKVTLVQEITDDVQAGFLIYLPFYKSQTELQSVEDRRRSIVGYVYSPFRMRDLMEGILGSGLPDVRLQIYDGVSTAEKDLMYKSSEAQTIGNPRFYEVVPFRFAGHNWSLAISSEPSFENKHTSRDAKIALIVGLITSFLIFGLQWSFATTGRRAQALAEEMTMSLEIRTQELAKARDEAQSASRAKTEFLSVISHELRTPLTSIKGSLALITAGALGALPEKIRELLVIADRNADRLITLVNDILDVEQIESGNLKYEFMPFDLSKLVTDVVTTNEGLAKQHGVNFIVDNRAETIPVRGDAERLTQVIANLLSNAAKYSPDGGDVTITIAQTGAEARISFTDQGSGVPEQFHGKIFERFSQADSSDTRLKGGTGLGLNISKSIVERHNGTIGFDPDIKTGSRFFFTIPIEKKPAEIAAE